MKSVLIITISIAMFGLMIPNIYADVTRTQNFDGIDGWTCYADDMQCNGPNKYPANIEQSTEYGMSIPSLHVGGDPTTGGAICAEKIIVSDWNIEKIDISLDVIGINLERVQPLVRIGELYGFYPSGENYEWQHSEHTQQIHVSEQNSISIKLCVVDENRSTENRNVYYDNVIIKTYEVDPNWESEQAAAADAAAKALAESEKAAQAAADAAQQAAAQAAADAAQQAADNAAATAAAQAAAQAAAEAAAEAAAQAAAQQAAANSAAETAVSNTAANQLKKINELNQQGLNLYDQGDFDNSLNKFNDVIKQDPVNIFALHYSGLIFFEKGMYSDSITYFKKILIFEPDDVISLEFIAYLEYMSGNYSESLKYYKQIISIDPNYEGVKQWISFIENKILIDKNLAAQQAAADAAAQQAAADAAQAATFDENQTNHNGTSWNSVEPTSQQAATYAAQQAQKAAQAAQAAAAQQAAADAAQAAAQAAQAAADISEQANLAAAQQAAADAAAQAAADAAQSPITDYVEIPSVNDDVFKSPDQPTISIDVTPENSEIFDTSSNSLDIEVSNNSYIFTKSWKNNHFVESQSFSYLLQITDSEGVIISLSEISGNLGPRQAMDNTLSFKPSSYGTYTATAYVWNDVVTPTALTHPESILIQFYPEESLIQKNLSNNWLGEFMP